MLARVIISVTLAGASLAALTTSARAVDVTECALMLEADEARLACYDRIIMGEMKKLKEEKPGVTPAVNATIASPAPLAAAAPLPAAPAAPAAPKSYKRIDPADVRATPEKWVNRDLEFATANIYWVADDDLRVLTKDNMTLFGLSPAGSPEDIAYLKDNCETSKEAQTSKCRVRVRFSYVRHSEDSPGGMFKRTVLVAPKIEFARLGKSRR